MNEYFEDLWYKKIGSSKLSESDELFRINTLLKKKVLTFSQARNLFYMTKFWARIRVEVLERDGYKCVLCGSVSNLQVDHISYKGIGNESINDLQTLCYYCHQNKTSKSLKKQKECSYFVSESDELFMVLRKKSLEENQNGE